MRVKRGNGTEMKKLMRGLKDVADLRRLKEKREEISCAALCGGVTIFLFYSMGRGNIEHVCAHDLLNICLFGPFPDRTAIRDGRVLHWLKDTAARVLCFTFLMSYW